MRRRGREGDASYDLREEKAKEAYYERKYGFEIDPAPKAKTIEIVQAEEVEEPNTLFEYLGNTFRPTISIDDHGKN